MPKPFLKAIGALGLFALIVLLLPQPPTLAASAGRDFSRCVQTCNEARKACDSLCKTDCAEMFPDDKSQRDSCTAACKSICVVESEECKQVCLSNKNGHPEEP